MKKRVGNDIKMTWTILRSGEAEVFDNATNIKIYAYQINSSTSNIEVDFVRNTNIFSLNIPASDLNVGTYDLRLTYNKPDSDIEGGIGSYAIDEHEAFQVVKHTEAEDAAGTDITGEVVYYHSSYVYIASASSALGADFTYPANISQDYLAILNSTTEIPEPSVTDFEGLWFSKIDAYRAAQIGGYTGTQEQLFLELASVQGLPEIIEDAITATTAANDAAALAVQKAGLANDAATLANTKANLADEKAGLANNAAILANEKAGLAATAATQANDARDGANDAAQSATNLVNSYATELAAKELKANKQNSLTVDGTGTKFPTVDAVNEGLGAKANVMQEAWITPTFLNGFAPFSLNQCSFYKDSLGKVVIQGWIKSSSLVYGTIFVLPVGYRPSLTLVFSQVSVDNVDTVIYVQSDGVVKYHKGAIAGEILAWSSLNISFSI